jgi:hypothetical protein
VERWDPPFEDSEDKRSSTTKSIPSQAEEPDAAEKPKVPSAFDRALELAAKAGGARLRVRSLPANESADPESPSLNLSGTPDRLRSSTPEK